MSYGHAGKILEHLASRTIPEAGKRCTIKASAAGFGVLRVYEGSDTVVASRVYLYGDVGKATMAMMAWDGRGEPPGEWRDGNEFYQ